MAIRPRFRLTGNRVEVGVSSGPYYAKAGYRHNLVRRAKSVLRRVF